jgi:hypothetical protein
MNLRELLADIHALEEELLVLERRYGLRSETFYAAYSGGEEPEEELGVGLWGVGQHISHLAGATGRISQRGAAPATTRTKPERAYPGQPMSVIY